MNSKDEHQHGTINSETQKRKNVMNENDQLSASLELEQTSIQNDRKIQDVKAYTKENRAFFQSIWKRHK